MSKGTRWMGAALTTLFACGLATEAGGQQPQYNFGPCPQTSVILGTEGPDTITGTPNADTILSFGANDIVDGQANRDCIMLGTGNDGGTGSGQADRVFGEQETIGLAVARATTEWTATPATTAWWATPDATG